MKFYSWSSSGITLYDNYITKLIYKKSNFIKNSVYLTKRTLFLIFFVYILDIKVLFKIIEKNVNK